MSEDIYCDEDIREEETNEAEDVTVERQENPISFQLNVVSGSQQNQSSEVNKLCIFDIGNKLKEGEKHDIGATYTNSEPDLSFYFTITNFYSERYILNLFVCHYGVGSFKIRISDTELLPKNKKQKSPPNHIICPGTLKSKSFTSSEANESHYVTSFYFSKSNIENIQALYIPIEIEMNVTFLMNEEVLTWIKQHHNKNIFKIKENTDFTIVSSSGTQYNTHKLLLASSYSPVLKEKIKQSKTNLITLDINDDEMSVLFELIYKNNISDIENRNWQQLLELAEKLNINYLRELVQKPISNQISIDNAVNIAILAEKYSLFDTQQKIIDYIKNNPAVLDTESWNNLDDVVLTKKY